MNPATAPNSPAPVALLVEDEPHIRRFVRSALEGEGCQVWETSTLARGLIEAASRQPDLVILDLGLPDGDGVDLVRELRGWTGIPVLILSARSDEANKVRALDAGADDYLTKPFSVEELLARLRATLRRIRYERGHANASSSFFENGELRIDFAAGCVTVDGQEVHLAPMEYKLLCLLANNVGKVLTHKTILQAVWGNTLAQSLPSLRVFMATLRKKLEVASPQCTCIRTHVGIGYRMSRGEG